MIKYLIKLFGTSKIGSTVEKRLAPVETASARALSLSLAVAVLVEIECVDR